MPLPHDQDAEMAVLGGVLMDGSQLDLVASIVKAEDFYVPMNGAVFAAMLELANEGQPIDDVTVVSKLNIGGAPSYLIQLVERTPTAANLKSYSRTIRDRSLQRKLINLGRELQGEAYDCDPKAIIEQYTGKLFELGRADNDRRIVHAKDAAREAWKKIEARYHKPDEAPGFRTGFTDLDQMLDGLLPGDLVVIAGRPSMGKTALLLALLNGGAVNFKHRSLIFELEMAAESLAMRSISALSNVSAQRMKRGQLTDSDWPRLANGSGKFADSRLVIDETPVATLADVRRVARQVQAEGGLDLIAIDYLQLMSSMKDRDNREREVAEISRGLKQIAKDVGVPLIALSQLNRGVESRSDKRPLLSDLRESGAIEQDADVIAFIYRDEVYNEDTDEKGITEVIIAKQRNGATGTVRLKFDKETQRFDNLQRDRP